MVPRKMQSRPSRHIFSASDDTTMTKNIRATHAPVDGHIGVRPLLHVVQDIFHRAASLIPGIVQVYIFVFPLPLSRNYIIYGLNQCDTQSKFSIY